MAIDYAWNRKALFTFGEPGTPGRTWENLDFTFNVKKSTKKEPNTLDLTIYGLSRESADWIREGQKTVRVIAGYEGDVGQIFLGDVDTAIYERDGVETVLNVEASDGGRKYREARINKSYGSDTTLRRVVEEVSQAMGLPLGDVDGIPDIVLADSLVLHGPARNQLDRLRAFGIEVWIQDGEIQIVPKERTAGEGPMISSETGLIGSPRPQFEKDSRKESGVEVVCLLQHRMNPGQRFELQSRQYSGIYKAYEVQHAGDIAGGEWYTTVIAKAS